MLQQTESQIPACVELRHPRLLLRTPTPLDDEAMLALLNDAHSTNHLPHLRKVQAWTMAEIVHRREAQLEAQTRHEAMVLYMFDEQDGIGEPVLVGTTGFTRLSLVSKTGMFGIIVANAARRRGLCGLAHLIALQYAFETLGLVEVEFNTLEANTAMRAFLETVGIRLCDVGGAWDPTSHNYFLSRAEWPAVKLVLQSRFF